MMDGFELPVTEVLESFYWINKCTKNVQLQHICQQESVHVTYYTSVYTTKWVVIANLSLVLNVTVTRWFTVCRSLQNNQPYQTVQFQAVAKCTLMSTVMLKMKFLASLNEFPSYRKPVLSKTDSIRKCFAVYLLGQGFPLEYSKRKSVTTN